MRMPSGFTDEGIRAVATGGSMIDPEIAAALVHPVHDADLTPDDAGLLEQLAHGRTVNLSQRLQVLARPGGTTVASAGTVAGADCFEWEDLGEVPVRGRDAPVAAYRLQ